MDAGEVVDVAVLDRPPAKFRVKLSIEQRLQVLVRTDSVVTIATEGVVGDKFLLVHQVRSFLYEVQPGNPWSFLLSAVVLVLMGLLAALIPARLAISIDPMHALRTE